METEIIVHGVGAAWPCACRKAFCRSCTGTDVPHGGWGNTGMSLLVGRRDAVKLHVLVDIGAGCCRSIQAANLPAPSVLFITHGHLDHLNLMELDTLRIMAKQDGVRRPVRVVATRRTWEQIPGFLAANFAFVEATIGDNRLSIGVVELDFLAMDASDHFAGGLTYVIEAAGLRHGFLFDKKTYANVDLKQLEGLDIALLEANTLEPMSGRTGHVSLAEVLEMLRSLKRPPRASFVFHYGHDEQERLSLGDRILYLAAIAPDLCVRWAYPGMTASSRYLPPRR